MGLATVMAYTALFVVSFSLFTIAVINHAERMEKVSDVLEKAAEIKIREKHSKISIQDAKYNRTSNKVVIYVKNDGMYVLHPNLTDVVVDNIRFLRYNLLYKVYDIKNPEIWDPEEILNINLTKNYSEGKHTVTVSNEYGVTTKSCFWNPMWCNESWKYRIPVDVREPSVNSRYNAPVMINLTLNETYNCSTEIRVRDENCTEIPAKIIMEKYAGSYCKSANISFLSNLSKDSIFVYYVYFSNPDAKPVNYAIFNYSCDIHSNSSNCSTYYYARYDIAQGLDIWNTNYPLSLTDDSSVLFNLPWPFPFFNRSYTSIYVHSNGYIDFTNATADAVPSKAKFVSKTMVAPLWDDLDPGTYGDVYNNTYSDRVVFTWNTTTKFSNNNITVQAVLYKTGDIMLRYSNVDGYNQSTHLAGVSNGTGYYLENPDTAYSKTAFYQYAMACNMSKKPIEKVCR